MNAPSLVLAALLISASALAPAHAQSKKELAAKIVTLQKAQHEQFGMNLAQAPIQQLVQNAGQVLRARVPADKREATGKAMDDELRAYMKDVGPALRASAVKHAGEQLTAKLEADFNETELKQVLQFLESPAIRRYHQIGAELNNAVAQKVLGDNRNLIETRAKALDQKLAELLGVKPAGNAPAASAAKP